jgi:hypothetical protein
VAPILRALDDAMAKHWEIQHEKDELEEELSKHTLPPNVKRGLLIDWGAEAAAPTAITSEISYSLLHWVSSEFGQASISLVESGIRDAIQIKKKKHQQTFKIGSLHSSQLDVCKFPSADIFQIIFEALGFKVSFDRSLNNVYLAGSATISW